LSWKISKKVLFAFQLLKKENKKTGFDSADTKKPALNRYIEFFKFKNAIIDSETECFTEEPIHEYFT